MAWRDTLLPASFRDILFDVISSRDDTERAIVQHEYPYRDGAEVEDMGRRPWARPTAPRRPTASTTSSTRRPTRTCRAIGR